MSATSFALSAFGNPTMRQAKPAVIGDFWDAGIFAAGSASWWRAMSVCGTVPWVLASQQRGCRPHGPDGQARTPAFADHTAR